MRYLERRLESYDISPVNMEEMNCQLIAAFR